MESYKFLLCDKASSQQFEMLISCLWMDVGPDALQKTFPADKGLTGLLDRLCLLN